LRGNDVAEQPVGFFVGPGGEVQGVGGDVEGAGGESQPPQPGDGDGAAVVSQLAEVLAGRGIVGVDAAVTEVADQDVAAEEPEGGGARVTPRGS
jgi:hypothetical protein